MKTQQLQYEYSTYWFLCENSFGTQMRECTWTKCRRRRSGGGWSGWSTNFLAHEAMLQGAVTSSPLACNCHHHCAIAITRLICSNKNNKYTRTTHSVSIINSRQTSLSHTGRCSLHTNALENGGPRMLKVRTVIPIDIGDWSARVDPSHCACGRRDAIEASPEAELTCEAANPTCYQCLQL